METQADRDGALVALDDIGRTQRAAARRLRSPWWYWHLFALIPLAYVALVSALPRGVAIWVMPVGILLSYPLNHWLRCIAPGGTFQWNARAKRIGWIYVAMSAVLAVCGAIGWRVLDQKWPLVVVFVMFYAVTRWLGPLSERGVAEPTTATDR